MEKEGFLPIRFPLNSTKFKQKRKQHRSILFGSKTRHPAISGLCAPSPLCICTHMRKRWEGDTIDILHPAIWVPSQEREGWSHERSSTWHLSYHFPGWGLERRKKQVDLSVLSPLHNFLNLHNLHNFLPCLFASMELVCVHQHQVGLGESEWFHLLPRLHLFS